MDSCKGSIFGMAIGDSIGASVEFYRRTKSPNLPLVTESILKQWKSYPNPHKLKPGQWTDDTSMALCLMNSLYYNGFDLKDQMKEYIKWLLFNKWGSKEYVFDVGYQTRDSIMKWADDISGFEPLKICKNPNIVGGNGCIMRLCPVPIYAYKKNIIDVCNLCSNSCLTTHSTQKCLEYASIMGYILHNIYHKKMNKKDIYNYLVSNKIITQNFLEKQYSDMVYLAENSNNGRGNSDVDTCFIIAIWGFLTTDSFMSGLIKVVNIGNDTDTVGAVYGQIAGGYYGYKNLPVEWINRVRSHKNDNIMTLTNKFLNKYVS